jgi:large subunit ribosomal protein L34e
MVKPMLRTRSRKKVQTRIPGGDTVLRHKAEKHKVKMCARCSTNLSGVPSDVSSIIRNLSKSEKLPNRPYAGVLCPQCVERLVAYTTRFAVKNDYPEFSEMKLQRDLTLERYLPKGWFASISKK